MPEVEDKNSGKRNQEVEKCRGDGEVERGLVQVILVKRHAAPGGLLQVLPLVLDVVHLCEDCPG